MPPTSPDPAQATSPAAPDTARYADNGSSRAGQPVSPNDHSAARRPSRTNCGSAQIGRILNASPDGTWQCVTVGAVSASSGAGRVKLRGVRTDHGPLRPAASGPVPGAALSLYSQFKTGNLLLEKIADCLIMANWGSGPTHARGSVTLCDQRADLTSQMPGGLLGLADLGALASGVPAESRRAAVVMPGPAWLLPAASRCDKRRLVARRHRDGRVCAGAGGWFTWRARDLPVRARGFRGAARTAP